MRRDFERPTSIIGDEKAETEKKVCVVPKETLNALMADDEWENCAVLNAYKEGSTIK